MGMPALHYEWTVDEVLALPDDGMRHECLDGEHVVTPAPELSHQGVLAELHNALSEYVRANQIGWLLWSPADIVFSPKRLVQPDLFVVPWSEQRPQKWPDIKHLLLAIEALSPSTARYDRIKKRAIYQSEGVNEYWIVDSDARLIERWRPTDERPEVITDVLEWAPHPGIAPLRVNVPALFDEALGPLHRQ
jgi:Uma2 family endonuclease